MKTSKLEVVRVSKRYGSVEVLRDISFEVSSYEALGYVGKNGSGKSTTVKILLGLTQPTSGTVLFNGVDINADISAWRERIGYVPELPVVYPYLSAMEHLELVGRLRSLPEPLLQQKASDLIHLLSLWDFRDMPMAGYSKGMKQRVLIAAALLHNPDVLILDEPLSGLDSESTIIFKRLITALQKAGKCILCCSHTIAAVRDICTRVAVLNKGEITGTGNADEVQAQIHTMEQDSVARERRAEQAGERVAQNIIATIAG